MKTFFAWTVCLFSLSMLATPALADDAGEAFCFTFRECDFSHRSIYTQDDFGPLPYLNDPLLVRAMLLAGAKLDDSLYHTGNAAVTRELLAAPGDDTMYYRLTDKTPLFSAPDAESTRLLLEAGADVNAEEDYLYTPIFYARNADVAEVLLAAGAKLTHFTGMTPLHTARDARTVELLVKAGVDPNAKTLLGGYTPLLTARNGEVTRALIAAGADPLYKTPEDETLLFFARDADTVRHLLAAGVDVNAVSKAGNTALGVYASYDGFRRGPRLSPPEALELDSLYVEIRPQEPAAMAELLVEAGADVNHRGQHDLTPLLMAHTPRLVALLLEKGADAAFQSGASGINALHIDQKPENVERLLAAGASVHALDMQGRSALFKTREADIMRLLLDAGATPGLRDVNESTPLHGNYDPDCIRMLVAAGVDPLAKNKWGQMPLDRRNWGKTLAALIDVMRQAGADPKEFLNDRRGDGDFLPFRLVNSNYSEIDDETREIVTRRSRWWRWEHYDAEHDFSNYTALRVLLEAGLNPNLVNDTGRTILFRLRAAETVRLLLEHGADAAATETRGFTPLHLAVYHGAQPEAVRLLLEAGADPNAESETGITPLLARNEQQCSEEYNENTPWGISMRYHTSEQPEAVKLLLDAGAKVDARNPDGDTPLHIYSKPESLRALIAAGADINAKGRYGRTPLHVAWNVDTMRTLVEAGADIHAKDENGNTPAQSHLQSRLWETTMYLAEVAGETDWREIADGNPYFLFDEVFNSSYRKNLEAFKKYAAAGVDLKMRNEEGHSLLHFASCVEMLEFLLAAGLDIHARDHAGNTPLHCACSDHIEMRHGHYGQKANPQVVRAMIAAGADVNAENNAGQTPLHMVRGKNVCVTAVLLECGAEVDARDDDGNTPLLSSVSDLLTCRVLLAHGADGKAKNRDDNTLLHLAAKEFNRFSYRSDLSMIKLALEQGVNVNAPDGELNTPLHLCAQSADAVELLMEAGADPRIQNLEGQDAFQMGTPTTEKIMRGEEVTDEEKDANTGLPSVILPTINF